ncbi:MAG: PAS domain-containing protein [Chloroflexi bacterium]|nr:ATP-binding protein [Chloroflexota bacterium]MQC26734.1 PAS domain-containing protein [Chloroflexota bacterium]
MTLSGISELSLFKRRSSGNEELEALLDLLPHPTLIANQSNGRIYFANTQAIQLSAYTRKELSELDLHTVVPTLDQPRLAAALSNGRGPQPFKLVTRSSKTIDVALTFSELGGAEHLVAVVVRPASELTGEKTANEQQKSRWEALQLLTAAAKQTELASCFRQILHAGNLLTGASHMALYIPKSDAASLELGAVWGSGLDFPSHLSGEELRNLGDSKVWQAGKTIEGKLHKLAHAAKLSYMASSPLDFNQASEGLLVAADELAAPPTDMLAMLQILAASAATAAMNARMLEQLSARATQLEHSNQLSEALQDNVQDGLIFLTRRFAIEEMNPAAEGMLGYADSEAIGRPATDIIISTHSLMEALENALQKAQSVDLGEVKLLRRDGTDFLAHVRLAPISDSEQVARIAVLINDLSENEALHVQSQQLQQRAWLGEVTAIFAHEVRNPINNISTGLQLMQINFEEDDPLQEQIKRLQEDCDRLEHRMKSVLSFSRSLDHNPEPIDIGEFCSMQIERWRPRMARNTIEPHIHVEVNTPKVLGDRRALDQVFTNLITNAIQAMEEQGNGVFAIKVRTNKADSAFVDIHISDSGPGIPEDLRKRVFDPFFTTKTNEGTGLGLAITKRIIMAHKGEIELESFPGGTLFKIKLPTAK